MLHRCDAAYSAFVWAFDELLEKPHHHLGYPSLHAGPPRRRQPSTKIHFSTVRDLPRKTGLAKAYLG